MIAAIADTHTAVWYLFNNPKLSARARQAIEEAFRAGEQIGVSSISLAESTSPRRAAFPPQPSKT